MSKLQPYKNLHCKYLHDDRYKFGTVGEVVWLRPSRAKRINDQMRAEGLPEALMPLDTSDAVSVDLPTLSPPFNRDCVFQLTAKERRSIARSLGAPKNVRTKIADQLIKDSPTETLKAAASLFLGG